MGTEEISPVPQNIDPTPSLSFGGPSVEPRQTLRLRYDLTTPPHGGFAFVGQELSLGWRR
jgi:hypothetical protein